MTNKKAYIVWFIVLIAPAIISKIAGYAGYPLLTEEEAMVITVIAKIGFIVLTIWYALKIKIKAIWATLLGLSTLLPLMSWVSLIILLTRKAGESKKQKKKSKFEEIIPRKDIPIFIIFIIIAVIILSILMYYVLKNTTSQKIAAPQIKYMRISKQQTQTVFSWGYKEGHNAKEYNYFEGCNLDFVNNDNRNQVIISQSIKNVGMEFINNEKIDSLEDSFCVKINCKEFESTGFFCFEKSKF